MERKLSLKNHRISSIFWGTVILAIAFYFLAYPFINLFIYGFKEGMGINGFIEVISSKKALEAFGDTVFLVIIRTVISVSIAIPIAWLIARTNMPYGRTIEFMFWLAYFIPSLPMTTGWILLLDPMYGVLNNMWMSLPFIDSPLLNIYSYAGITLAHLSISTIPIKVMLITPALRYLSADLEEASQIGGANHLKSMRDITIPLVMPTILVVTMLGIIRGLEAFEVEVILGTPAGISVFSTLIYDYINWSPPDFPAAASLASVFGIIMFMMVLLYRWVTSRKNYTTVTGRGFNSNKLDIGKWKNPASVISFAIISFLMVLPVSALVFGTFMSRFGFFHLPEPYSTKHWAKVLQSSELIDSVINSLIIGVAVAVFGVLLYALIAYYIQRTKHYGKGLIDLFLWIPWALSGILLGLAMLRFILSNPITTVIYGSLFALVLLLIMKEMPLGTQILRGALFQMNTELEEASKVAGASAFRTFFYIVLPLIRPTLISVAVIAFVAALREVGGLILLTTPGTRTMSVMLLDYLGDQRFEQAAVLGVVLTMIIAVVAFAARRYGLNIGPGK
jgi:iron(III) transport system permease protein